MSIHMHAFMEGIGFGMHKVDLEYKHRKCPETVAG